jgi:hypothetical protein
MNGCVPEFAGLVDAPVALHPLHDPERAWPQTNCAVDLLIELVAAYGQDPVWMLGFTVIQDFEGDHFTFFKVPSDDLEALYGLSVQELAVWDDLEAHVVEQLQRGRVVLVEVDGFYLPDTRGVTYQVQHGKTTIGIFAIDTAQRRMGYFHNETRGVLFGEDYDAVLQKMPSQAQLLMPYCEVVKRMALPTQNPAQIALSQLQRHWLRRPTANPFAAYAQHFPKHLASLQARGPAYFHAYAFNTLRQAGANFGLMDSFLSALPGGAFVDAAHSARRIADEAKVLQFRLARAVARNKFEGLEQAADSLAELYTVWAQQLGQALEVRA